MEDRAAVPTLRRTLESDDLERQRGACGDSRSRRRHLRGFSYLRLNSLRQFFGLFPPRLPAEQLPDFPREYHSRLSDPKGIGVI